MTEQKVIQWAKDNFDSVNIGYFLYWVQVKDKPEHQFYKEYNMLSEKYGYQKLLTELEQMGNVHYHHEYDNSDYIGLNPSEPVDVDLSPLKVLLAMYHFDYNTRFVSCKDIRTIYDKIK